MVKGMSSRHGSLALLIAVLIITLPADLFGNLAVFSTSDIQRTGNLVPIRKTMVELVREKFSATLEAETARVVVDYEFLNTGGADSVTVGFPVDLMPAAGDGSSYNLDHWRKKGLQALRIIDGTNVLPIERTVDETLRSEDRPKLTKDVAITRRWSIATIGFKARERKNVRVSYLVRCMGVDEGFDTEIPHKISGRTFLYAFRTAAGWGKGRVHRLDIALDGSYLQQNRFPIQGFEPQLKHEGGGLFRRTFQNVALSRVPDLIVRYDPKPALFQMYGESHLLRPSNWKSGTCGSRKLGTDTFTDGNPETAWRPKFMNGRGDCLEVTPRNGSYINAIAILNGDQSSPEAFGKNARIKKLRIEYTAMYEEGRKREVLEQTLADRTFDDRVARFPMAMAQFLDLPSGPEGILETVKLTVLEVYPGASNAPWAISELYVYGVNGEK